MSSVEYSPVTKDEVAFVGTGPISSTQYVDEDWYDLEKEAIFRRVWLHVGRTDEVAQPGQFIVREIEVCNASLIIVRGSDGRLRAFYNVCMHRGTELVSDAFGTAATFSCRYHKWTYGNNGELRHVPDIESFFDLDKKNCGLMEVALDTCAGFIFINLDPTPKQSLRQFLGAWADRLEGLDIAVSDVFSEYVYEVNANWKVAYDNFQEIYHGRFVHSRSIGASNQAPENPYGYPTKYTFGEDETHRSKTLWFNPRYVPAGPVEDLAVRSAAPQRQVEPGPAPRSPGSTEHFYMFPNVTLLSGGKECFTQTIWPLGPAKCRGVIRMYFPGTDRDASTRFVREYRMANTLDVHCEDRDIIEAAQRGLANRALPGVKYQIHEVTLRHAAVAVERYVNAYKAELAATEDAQ